mmetsp:Transcript_65545/g.133324  ORF Transcript_65545/g.133324 Transcript_65545/m.133324 type:complete len:200 (-) Transcript_65545:228-827(-)
MITGRYGGEVGGGGGVGLLAAVEAVEAALADPGKAFGAEIISPAGEEPLETPGESGPAPSDGFHSEAVCPGRAPLLATRSLHWLAQNVILEPSSGPAAPSGGQLQEPEPRTSHGPQVLRAAPEESLYARNMHLEPDSVPRPKQEACEAAAPPTAQAWPGCRSCRWCEQDMEQAVTCCFPIHAPTVQHGMSSPSNSQGKQ